MLWGEEMDSPRGRIYLMKAGVEGACRLTPSFVQHFDACLGCLACVTACPSGVQYGPLIEQTRAQIEQQVRAAARRSLFRRRCWRCVPYPAAHAPGAAAAGAVRRRRPRVGRALMARRTRAPDERAGSGHPLAATLSSVVAALALSPPVSLRSLFASTPEHTPAVGEAAPEGGGAHRLRAAARVRRRQRGDRARAGGRRLQRHGAGGAGLLRRAGAACRATSSRRARWRGTTSRCSSAAGVDRIVVNAAGCGSAMKEYGELFADDPAWAARAHAFSAKVRDVSELLVGAREPRARRGIRSGPRGVSRRLPPGARPGRPRAAARAAAGDSRAWSS